MIDLALAQRRFELALEQFVTVAKHIKEDGHFLWINGHHVHLGNLNCDCTDFQRQGKFTPCKHLFIGMIYQNSLNHDG